jgi:AAA domain-containing protein
VTAPVSTTGDAFLALRAGLANVVMDSDSQFTADCLDRSHRMTVTRGPRPDTLSVTCPCGPAIVPFLNGRFGLTLTEESPPRPAPRAGNGRVRDLLRPDFIPPAPRVIRFLTAAELEARPRPSYLIEGILPTGALGVLYGPPGAYKSFVALDWACSIACGLSWQGRAVERGTAAYVLAEGSGNFGARVDAWRSFRQSPDLGRAHFFPEAVRLLDPADVAALLAGLTLLPAPLRVLVVDTLAQSMAGGDENSTEDMGSVIDAANRIRRETGAAVLLLHHPGWNGDHMRGNTSLHGAADVVLKATKDQALLTLTCEKMKDAEPFPPLTRALVPHGGSLVLSLADRAATPNATALSPHARTCCTILARDFLEEGATASEWKTASRTAGVPETSSFYRARTELVRLGYVTRAGDGTRRHPYRYQVTHTGRFFGQGDPF